MSMLTLHKRIYTAKKPLFNKEIIHDFVHIVKVDDLVLVLDVQPWIREITRYTLLLPSGVVIKQDFFGEEFLEWFE